MGEGKSRMFEALIIGDWTVLKKWRALYSSVPHIRQYLTFSLGGEKQEREREREK